MNESDVEGAKAIRALLNLSLLTFLFSVNASIRPIRNQIIFKKTNIQN